MRFAFFSALTLSVWITLFARAESTLKVEPTPSVSTALSTAAPLTAAPPTHSLAPYSLDSSPEFIKTTASTGTLLRWLSPWPPETIALKVDQPVIIRAIQTPGEPHLIGMVKHSTVHASLPHVIEVTEKFEEYPKIWEDILEAKVQSRDRNRTRVAFTRKSPGLFLPKVRFETLYTVDASNPARVIYRQQLIEGNLVKASDSLVILEKVSDTETRITVFNFFDPDLGLLNSIAGGKIWRESLIAGYRDELAFRSRVEHPDWTLKQIRSAVDETLEAHPLQSIEYYSRSGTP